jgi:putative sigma-54 modulation protein
MRLVLTGRNVEVTPALRNLVERKLVKLDRLMHDSVMSAMIVLTREKYRHVTEITAHTRGDHMLHGLGNASVWSLSVAQAVEKIAKQAHRVKDKWETRKRRGRGRRAPMPPPAPPVVPGETRAPAVVRTKRYPIKPMSVDDAAARLDNSSDTFVVFRNVESDGVSIVFRRRDGRFGLIALEA